MSYNIPGELRYSKTHEWVRDMGDNIYKFGVSEYAAKHIGDVTYIEFPEVDSDMEKDDTECVVETVKSSEDVVNHINGTVVNVNEDILADTPELVNSDCYEDGWLFSIKAEDDSDFKDLMTADQYKEYLSTLED